MPYAYVDPAAAQESRDQAQAQRAQSGRRDGWKPEVGERGRPAARNVFRIMPPHPGMLDEKGRPIWHKRRKVHFQLGPNKDGVAECLEESGQACPACTNTNALKRASQEHPDPVRRAEYDQMAYDQRASWQASIQIVDMLHPERGVQPYDLSDAVLQKLEAAFFNDDSPPVWRDITHPETGRDVIMDVSARPAKWGGNVINNYDLVKAKDTPSALANPEWLEQIADLTKRHPLTSAADMTALIEGRSTRQHPMVGPATTAPTTRVLPPPTAMPPVSVAASIPPPAPPPPAPIQMSSTLPPSSAPPPPAPPPALHVVPSPPGAEGRKKSKRKAVEVAPDEANGDDPWAVGRAAIVAIDATFTPRELTVQDLANLEEGRILHAGKPVKPPRCFRADCAPHSPTCQRCGFLLACATSMVQAGEALKLDTD